MHYKDGYLTMFTKISVLLEELQIAQYPYEQVNVIRCLQEIQAAGEEACIADKSK